MVEIRPPSMQRRTPSAQPVASSADRNQRLVMARMGAHDSNPTRGACREPVVSEPARLAGHQRATRRRCCSASRTRAPIFPMSSRAAWSRRGWRDATRTGGSHELYDFAAGRGATVVRTAISRTVIDVNRDPSGASLYPGQATTELCPTTTFDGEPLYLPGREPDARRYLRPARRVITPPITQR